MGHPTDAHLGHHLLAACASAQGTVHTHFPRRPVTSVFRGPLLGRGSCCTQYLAFFSQAKSWKGDPEGHLAELPGGCCHLKALQGTSFKTSLLAGHEAQPQSTCLAWVSCPALPHSPTNNTKHAFRIKFKKIWVMVAHTFNHQQRQVIYEFEASLMYRVLG